MIAEQVQFVCIGQITCTTMVFTASIRARNDGASQRAASSLSSVGRGGALGSRPEGGTGPRAVYLTQRRRDDTKIEPDERASVERATGIEPA